MRHLMPHLSRGLIVFLCSLSTAWGQAVSTAQINGTVRDPDGLPLPGVTVTATQTDTGLTRTAVTDETGSYVLQNLPVGPYRFEASLAGFRTFEQTGIVLQVGANPTLGVTLELGQVEETLGSKRGHGSKPGIGEYGVDGPPVPAGDHGVEATSLGQEQAGHDVGGNARRRLRLVLPPSREPVL